MYIEIKESNWTRRNSPKIMYRWIGMRSIWPDSSLSFLLVYILQFVRCWSLSSHVLNSSDRHVTPCTFMALSTFKTYHYSAKPSFKFAVFASLKLVPFSSKKMKYQCTCILRRCLAPIVQSRTVLSSSCPCN